MIDWKKIVIVDHSDIKRLDYVVRYNSIPSFHKESVSQHSYWVTLYSVILHRKLCESNNCYDPSVEHRILLKALTHDIGECLTGDVVRTFKYSSTEFKNAVDIAEQNMVDNYLPKSITDIINTYSNERDEHYINAVIKASDFISLFHYMNREHNRGNREIFPFITRMQTDMAKMHDKLCNGNWYEKELSKLYEWMGESVFHLEEDRPV